MNNTASGFLRFEVCGQIFAIPMADLAGIQQTNEAAARNSDEPTVAEPRVYVAPTSLAALFFGEADQDGAGVIVVVHVGKQMFVMLVDRVLAGTDVLSADRSALPSMVAAFESPFTGLFWDAGRWGLIVDAERLASMIRQRYSNAAAEHIYDIQ